MFRKFVTTAAAITMMAWSVAADAAPIVFTTSGVNSVSGKATFNFSASSFTVTLENLTASLSQTAQELDGLTFKLSPGGAAPTLTSVAAQGILDCSGDHVFPCAAYGGAVPANDGWGVSTNTGLSNLTTLPLGFHPFAIINPNYVLPAQGNGNLANPQHNPFLMGPVVFTFIGAFTGVSDVTFFWGTRPDTTVGVCLQGCDSFESTAIPTPEPTSMVLLGTGLAYAARRRVRRKQ